MRIRNGVQILHPRQYMEMNSLLLVCKLDSANFQNYCESHWRFEFKLDNFHLQYYDLLRGGKNDIGTHCNISRKCVWYYLFTMPIYPSFRRHSRRLTGVLNIAIVENKFSRVQIAIHCEVENINIGAHFNRHRKMVWVSTVHHEEISLNLKSHFVDVNRFSAT